MSLKRVMKFTIIWFLKNEVAMKSLWSVFGSHRNKVGLCFLTSMKIHLLILRRHVFLVTNARPTDGNLI